jgi:hypothetical protein
MVMIVLQCCVPSCDIMRDQLAALAVPEAHTHMLNKVLGAVSVYTVQQQPQLSRATYSGRR